MVESKTPEADATNEVADKTENKAASESGDSLSTKVSTSALTTLSNSDHVYSPPGWYEC